MLRCVALKIVVANRHLGRQGPTKGKGGEKAIFSLERNYKVLYLFSESLSCLHVLIGAELSRQSRATLHRNAQKSVTHVQSCCFANQNLSLF